MQQTPSLSSLFPYKLSSNEVSYLLDAINEETYAACSVVIFFKPSSKMRVTNVFFMLEFILFNECKIFWDSFLEEFIFEEDIF